MLACQFPCVSPCPSIMPRARAIGALARHANAPFESALPFAICAGAIFDMFLGEEPLDDYGKKDVGHGMLWAANGFRCMQDPWRRWAPACLLPWCLTQAA